MLVGPSSYLLGLSIALMLFLFLYQPYPPSFIPLFLLHPLLIIHVPRFLLPRTPLSTAPTSAFPTLADSSSVCSLLLSALLFSALFLLSIQLVISCCIWLISSSLPLNHGFVLFSSKPHTSSATLVVYLLSSPSWLHSPHPFWCVSPG